jgi:hypothetical protein
MRQEAINAGFDPIVYVSYPMALMPKLVHLVRNPDSIQDGTHDKIVAFLWDD